MARNFRELLAKMSPEAQARVKQGLWPVMMSNSPSRDAAEPPQAPALSRDEAAPTDFGHTCIRDDGPESTGASLRDELAEIIRWRFKSADGKPVDGAGALRRAQEIADAIAPMIEEAVGERGSTPDVCRGSGRSDLKWPRHQP